MNRFRSLTTLIVVAGLAASADAQVFPSVFFPQNEVAKPSAPGNSTLWTRIVAGDITGDSVQDVALLMNGSVAFFYDPFSFASSTVADFGQTVNDVALEPRTAVNPVSALVTVGSVGLRRLAIDLSTGEFAAYTTIDTVKWVRAKCVRSAQIDMSGGADYVGVAENGHTIIVRTNSTGGTQQFEFTSYNSSTVQDLALVQWDTTPAPEIALLSSYGIEVYTATGSLLRKAACPGVGSDAFAVLDNGYMNTQALAWLVRNSGGTSQALYMYRPGPTPILQVQISNLSTAFDDALAVSIAAADIDGDTDQDLAIAHQGSYLPRIFRSAAAPTFTPATPWFTTADSAYVNTGSADPEMADLAAVNVASLVFRDLDNNLTQDLVIPVESAGKIKVLRGPDPGYNMTTYLFGIGSKIYPATEFLRQVDVQFQIPDQTVVPIGVNSLDVLVWRQGPIAGEALLPDLVSYWTYPLELTGNGFNTTGVFTVDLPPPDDLPLNADNKCLLQHTYWIDVRLAERPPHPPFPEPPILAPIIATKVRIGAASSNQATLVSLVADSSYSVQLQTLSDSAAHCGCFYFNTCTSGTTPLPVSVVEKRSLPPTANGGLPKIPGNTVIRVRALAPPQ